MTLREIITEELLNAVEHPEQLENISRTYGRSKGPYYAALLDATNQLQDQLDELLEEISDAIEQKKVLEQQVTTQHDKRDGLAQEVQVVEERLNEGNARLAESQDTLDRAVELERMGFGTEELTRLYEILAQLAANQGAVPEEAVAEFFRTIQRYEQVVSLDLEATRAESRAAQAKAEAERWESEADAREVQSKARIAVIDLLEDLLGKGIKADDFVGWSVVIEKAGVTVEELAESLVEYSTIQALSADRQKQAEEIRTQITGLEAEVLGLAQERDGAHSAIEAVRDKALKTVRAAESQAKQQVDTLFRDAVELGGAREEAAALGEWIEAAQLLKSGDPESWKQLPLEVIQHMVLVTFRWAEAEGRDVQVPLPANLRRGSLLPSWTKLRLSEVLLWALVGLTAEDGQRTLSASR